MIIKEDVSRILNPVITGITSSGSIKNPNVKKIIQRLAELKQKWVLVHDKKRFGLTNTLTFYYELRKSTNEISQLQLTLKELQELNALAKTSEKLEILKTKTKRTIAALFVSRWFEKAELFYNAAKQQLMPANGKNGSENTPFWNIISGVLQKALKYALDDLQKNLTTAEVNFFEQLVLHLSRNIEDFAFQSQIQVKHLYMLHNLCVKTEGRFLRYFNQNKHPYPQGMDTACLGIVFDWAEKLHFNPPTQIGLHSQEFSKLLPLFQCVDSLPQTWPFTYLRFGESDYSIQGVKYQLNGFLYLHQNKMPTCIFEKLRGAEIAEKALQFFSSDTNVSTLVVSLNTMNQEKEPPHAIGLASIRLTDQLTVYRIMDADEGEFELYSADAFRSFLGKYFEFVHYSEHYSQGYLKNIDSTFEKNHSEFQSLVGLEIEKGLRKPRVHV